jgi:two-component system cell cycle sensor histidine kinase PleC
MIADEESLQAIAEALDKISDAFVVYDRDGRLVACNQTFKQLYQYTDEEARPGVHFSELGRLDVTRGKVVMGEGSDVESYLERKAQYRHSLEGSFVVQLADGRWIRATDRRTRSGGFVSIQTDVTDLILAQQELRAAKEQAERANRAKSEFLANMSHELRTPLNAIIGFGTVLEQELYGRHSSSKYKEYARDICEAGRHLLGLINDILDISKIESDRLELEEGVVDPLEMNEWCRSLFDDLVLRSGVDLVLAVEGEPFLLLGDPQRLRQVMVNLVSNAIKFTPAGGRVAVCWRLVNGRAELTVADSGVGIDPAFLPHVFEPFRQGDAGRPVDGAGLGLALVKRFVDLHGGTVAIASTPGQGTLVTAELPAERVALPRQQARA